MITDEEIIKKLNIRKRDKVLDVGGSMMQHEKISVHTLVDIIKPEKAPYTRSKLKAKNFVKVDIAREKLPFKKNSFDVCLCTHTLEDLYNPFLIMEEMSRVSKRGLIITPSMGFDMVYSPINITDWLTGPRRTPGLSHHKWFFMKKNGKVLVIPKNYGILYSEMFNIVKWKGRKEFVYIWQDKISFKIFPELNIHKLIDFYEEFIKDNRKYIKFGKVLSYKDSVFNTLKAYSKYFLKRGNGFKYRKKL